MCVRARSIACYQNQKRIRSIDPTTMNVKPTTKTRSVDQNHLSSSSCDLGASKLSFIIWIGRSSPSLPVDASWKNSTNVFGPDLIRVKDSTEERCALMPYTVRVCCQTPTLVEVSQLRFDAAQKWRLYF